MNPDNLQQAWQAQSSQTRVTIDANLLLNEVQRNQRNFRATILRRDVIEVAVGVLMLPYWVYQGLSSSMPWTWWLTVPAILWVTGFFLVDRVRHPQTPSDPSEPLLNCVTNSLSQVEHQIWLLRNVFWWYLLPFTISILAFFAQSSLQLAGHWLAALGVAIPFFAFLWGIYYFIDYINQRAVRRQLEPRRQELLALAASLRGDDSAVEPATPSSEYNFERPRIFRRWLVVAALTLAIYLLILLVLGSGLFDSHYDGPPKTDGPAGASLGKLVTDLRKEKHLVGLAAMVIVDGQLVAAAASGERMQGSGVPIEIGDRWHLGGITKSITATMIARLVESGRMKWSDTLGDIFPDASIHEQWKPVTLRQLLTDASGAPPEFPFGVWLQKPALGPESTQARKEAVLNVIMDKPACPPGTKNVYSNVGYAIAAAMAEKVTGDTWDDLVKREVVEPLELAAAGFGQPKSSDETIEQPRGHRNVMATKVPVDDKIDFTPIIGPSALVHMSLRDLCTYANEHLRGELGQGKLLSSETYMLLHTPALNDYACGWVKKEPGARGQPVMYWHNGSNHAGYALVVFIPERKMVVAVTTNDGDFEQSEAAAWEIVKASLKQFNVEDDAERRQSEPPEAFARKSPFAAIRWQESQPEVKVGDEWLKLVSLDDLPAAEIVAFSQQTYGNKWQMRFEEDLVELLTRMGHTPKDAVRLVVSPLGSTTTRTLEEVPMTEANRRAIKAAAQARGNEN